MLTKKIIKYLLVSAIYFSLFILICTIQTSAIEYHNEFDYQNIHLPATFEIEYPNEVVPGSQQTIKISLKQTTGGYLQIGGYKLDLGDFGLDSPPMGSQSIPLGSLYDIADVSLVFASKVDCDVSGQSHGRVSSNQITIDDFEISEQITVEIDKNAKKDEEVKIIITPHYTINAKLKAKVILIGDEEIGNMNLTRINGNPMVINMKVKKPFPFIPIVIVSGIIIIAVIVFLIWKRKKTSPESGITNAPPVGVSSGSGIPLIKKPIKNRPAEINITPNITTCRSNIPCPVDGTMIHSGEKAFKCRTCGALYHPGCAKVRLRTSNTCIICKKSLI